MATKKKTAKAKAKNKKTPVTPTKQQKVEKAQAKKAIQQTIVNRELKWLYPEDCTDTLSRKAFRQKVRNKIRKLERDILKLSDKGNSKEAKSLSHDLVKLREESLADPQTQV